LQSFPDHGKSSFPLRQLDQLSLTAHSSDLLDHGDFHSCSLFPSKKQKEAVLVIVSGETALTVFGTSSFFYSGIISHFTSSIMYYANKVIRFVILSL